MSKVLSLHMADLGLISDIPYGLLSTAGSDSRHRASSNPLSIAGYDPKTKQLFPRSLTELMLKKFSCILRINDSPNSAHKRRHIWLWKIRTHGIYLKKNLTYKSETFLSFCLHHLNFKIKVVLNWR